MGEGRRHPQRATGSGGLWEAVVACGVHVDLVMGHGDDELVSVYLAGRQESGVALARIRALADVETAVFSDASDRVIEVRARGRRRGPTR